MTDNVLAKQMYSNKVEINAKIKAVAEKREHDYRLACTYDSGVDGIFEYYVDDVLNTRIFICVSMKNNENPIYIRRYKQLKSGELKEYDPEQLTASGLHTMIVNVAKSTIYEHYYDEKIVRTTHAVYDIFYSDMYWCKQFLCLFSDHRDSLKASAEAGLFKMSKVCSHSHISIPEANPTLLRLQKDLIPVAEEKHMPVTTFVDPSNQNSVYAGVGRYYYLYRFYQNVCAAYGPEVAMAQFIRPYIDNSDLDIGRYSYEGVPIMQLFRDSHGSKLTEGELRAYNHNFEKMGKDGVSNPAPEGLSRYIFQTSFRMGWADDIGHMVNLLGEVYSQQINLYGKVKNKYPFDLDSLHKRLEYKVKQRNKLRAAIAENNLTRQFDEAVERNKEWNMTYKGFSWRSFESLGELVDVSDNILHNCLHSSYVRRIANGESIVLIMFDKLNPDVPQWAVEVGKDGKESEAYDYDYTYINPKNTEEQYPVTIPHYKNYYVKQAFAEESMGMDLSHLPRDVADAVSHLLVKSGKKLDGELDEKAEALAEAEAALDDIAKEIAEEQTVAKASKEELDRRRERFDPQHDTVMEDF